MHVFNALDQSITNLDLSEEEIIQRIKLLGCPLPLHITLFKSIGLPNNWHQLLAVLDWLCEMVGDLLEVQKEEIDSEDQSDDDEKALHWAVGEEMRNRKFSATEFLRKKYQPKIISK